MEVLLFLSLSFDARLPEDPGQSRRVRETVRRSNVVTGAHRGSVGAGRARSSTTIWVPPREGLLSPTRTP